MSKSQILSWLKFLIGWPLSLISIIFIVKLVFDKSQKIVLNFSEINLTYLLIGLFLFFTYYIFRSYLWKLILGEKGHHVRFIENTYRFSFSEIKRYIPGNIWSFLSRTHQFSLLGIDKKTLGLSIIADIQLVIIGSFVASLFAIPWLMETSGQLYKTTTKFVPVALFFTIIYFAISFLVYRKSYDKNANLASSIVLPGFHFSSKVKLIIISSVTYFIFGVGNYFVFLSIFNQDFNNFLILSSFFTFSLLIGYLSFIAPMGLGVRETIVTIGLSKITSLELSGIISIYTRIVLVISELLFISIIFLWYKFLKK